MRFCVSALVVAGALSLGVKVGAQQYSVRTMAAPSAMLTRYHSFHLLPTPRRHDGARKSGAYDPMVSNSIANRALRGTVSGELEALGYHDSEWMPDFVVAIYATTHQRLDLGMWEYGYRDSPEWWSVTVPDQASTSYPEGTIIVDIVDPETLDVLWRGSATIALDHDPLENAKELVNAAAAIIDRFPRAKPIAVAARQ
jgi:Domain of unknown function (DUF4136)